MAFTYLILNLIFIAGVLAFFWRSLRRPGRVWWLSFLALLLLTLVFDSLMLALGFFSYDTTKLTGIYVGLAPIEDFFYAILAAMLVPLLWKKFEPRSKEKRS